jgi:hypothetical protein
LRWGFLWVLLMRHVHAGQRARRHAREPGKATMNRARHDTVASIGERWTVIGGGLRTKDRCQGGMHYLPLPCTYACLDQVGALASFGWRCWIEFAGTRVEPRLFPGSKGH